MQVKYFFEKLKNKQNYETDRKNAEVDICRCFPKYVLINIS